MPALHPDEVLAATGAVAGALPVCEHYAGNEKKLAKALALQQSRHGDFDVTIDLEDGAVAGQEKETVAAQVALVNQFFSDPANHVRRPDGSACRFGCRVHPFDHPSLADRHAASPMPAPAMGRTHPRDVLLGAQAAAGLLPVCDHYSGVEARMRKSLQM